MQYQLRRPDPPAARELGRLCRVAPAVAQVLLNRGLSDAEAAREWLTPLLSGLTPPDDMADRQAAADRLSRAIRAHERIAVFGDYDVDGTASAALLTGILEQLGGDVSALVGNRFDGGYGLNDAALDRVLELRPSLLVACDCGSSDHERLQRARKAGLDTIVVDHHMTAIEPLPTLAFINPHRPDCPFPYKGLASVGLALSLGAAVRAGLDVKLDLRSWLDLVALGTVADVAPLDGDNRRLVRAGLSQLAAANGRPGVVALREAARIRPGSILSASDVSFRFSPRLNAAGRLGDQTLSLLLLRSRDLNEAHSLAVQMERINQQRKQIEQRVSEEAIEQVVEIYGEEPKTAIAVAKQGWHRGVVGICASRLVDRFGVPSAVIALDGETGRGSCRTARGFNLYDAIKSCSHLLEAFGGHQAAAGLTISASRVDAFRSSFAESSTEWLSAADGQQEAPHLVDVRIEPGLFDLPTASDLSQLEPVGAANAEPVFLIPEAQVESSAVVGGAHLKLNLRAGRQRLTAFGFKLGARPVQADRTISALGVLRPDTWKGGDQVELWLKDFEQ